MIKSMKKILMSICITLGLCSCEQQITRQYGGTTTIKLEKGEKLIEVTWKDEGDLWYLVEDMDSDYTPKVKVFKESSMYGLLEGKVVFIEHK